MALIPFIQSLDSWHHSNLRMIPAIHYSDHTAPITIGSSSGRGLLMVKAKPNMNRGIGVPANMGRQYANKVKEAENQGRDLARAQWQDIMNKANEVADEGMEKKEFMERGRSPAVDKWQNIVDNKKLDMPLVVPRDDAPRLKPNKLPPILKNPADGERTPNTKNPRRRARTPSARTETKGKDDRLDPLSFCWAKALKNGDECYVNKMKYRVIKKLGFGADGDVFLAKQYYDPSGLNKEQDVALKQYKKKASFSREVNLLVALRDCKYSTHLLDMSPERDATGRGPALHIVVMDFVAGGDLRNFMLQPHPTVKDDLPIAIFKKYLMDLSEPLSIINNNLNFMVFPLLCCDCFCSLLDSNVSDLLTAHGCETREHFGISWRWYYYHGTEYRLYFG